MADPSIGSQLLIAITSAFVASTLTSGVAIYVWRSSRLGERRDHLAKISGEWLAAAFDCVEAQTTMWLRKEDLDKARKATPTIERSLAFHLTRWQVADEKASAAATSLESAMARFRIESPDSSSTSYAQRLTSCIRGYPYGGEDADWFANELNRYCDRDAEIGKFSSSTAYLSQVRLSDARELLVDFSIRLAHELEAKEPAYFSD